MNNDVADVHPVKRTRFNSFWATKAAANPKKNGHIVNITHRNIGNGYIFQITAVHGFQSQSLAAVKNAIGDGYIFKAAVRLRSKFNSAGVTNTKSGIK